MEGLLRRIGDKVTVNGSTILTSPSSSRTDIIDGATARPSNMRADSSDISTVKARVEGAGVAVEARGPTTVVGDTGTTVLGAWSDAYGELAPLRWTD